VIEADAERRAVTDREWVQAVLARYEVPLILYAAKVCGDVDRARDAVQETLLELCATERALVEPKLAEWLFTVCRNKALDLRRKETTMKTEREVLAEDRASHDSDPQALMSSGEERTHVLALVARLPQKQQEVLRLKFQAGLSYKEIAGVTGDSIGNVGFLLHVALRSLRERLAVEGKVAS
jgi:RNA polymerase sigma-70 factor (ECF subfamily)